MKTSMLCRPPAGTPPSPGGAGPRSPKLLLHKLHSEFLQRINLPPAKSIFQHNLPYQIAKDLYQNGKKALSTLVQLLEENVWVTQYLSADRNSIATTLMDTTRTRDCSFPSAVKIGADGLPCDRPFLEKLLAGKVPLSFLTEEEQSINTAAVRQQFRAINRLYYFYCLNRGAEANSSEEKLHWYNLAMLFDPNLPFVYMRIVVMENVPVRDKEQYFDFWLKTDPEPSHSAPIYLVIGCLSFAGGDREKAHDYVQKAIELSEANSPIWQMGYKALALFLYDSGDTDAALPMARIFYGPELPDHEILNLLSLELRRLSQKQSAN